uniref:Membrane insertase YidC n=1 Tax=Davidia involucrata TaxID=16924 RepID=A0A5B7B2D5_DAVIN
MSHSHPNALPPPPLQLRDLSPAPAPAPLYKQKSWSPDTCRDEAWLKRKGNHDRRKRRSKSVTDEDLDELKACIELGFGFDSPEMDQRLSDTLPALGLYYAVNKQYYDSVSKPSSSSSSSFSSTASDCDTPSPLGSPHTIFGPGDNPQMVKTRLKQWAQVVACSVRQSSLC